MQHGIEIRQTNAEYRLGKGGKMTDVSGKVDICYRLFVVLTMKAALRVPLAVTWLTVYRQLQI